jgi:hypothetical protein
VNHQDDTTLARSELEALRALRRDEDAGRLLEERTVRALRGQGLLVTHATMPMRRWAWAAAAAVAFFVIGFTLGRTSGVPSDPNLNSATRIRPASVEGDTTRSDEAVDGVRIANADSTSGARFVVWF